MLLLSPLDLAGRTAKNRLIFGPHETNLALGRSLSDDHVAYYRRRAIGGAGLIVTETASVHPLDWPYERSPLAADCGPGWQATADACHAEQVLAVASIGHAGMQGTSAYSQRETWAPSRVADAVTRELGKEMEPDEIEAVLAGFGEATAIAMAAGMDGVEINAGQFSLVRQFMSGLTNQRWDQWGLGDDGSNRLAFPLAVIERVRRQAGDGIVGLRLSCDELAPWAGLTPELAAAAAVELAPLVDYLVVVRGSIYSSDATRPDTHVPAGFNLDLVGQVRAAVAGATPVVAQGSIIDPGQAEWALDDGRADLVEMTRAQIADPDLGSKLRAGDAARVRPCLLCNQRCRVRDGRNPIVSCVVNPTTGFEASEPEAAGGVGDHSVTMHIVGAGPAGLEAARVAASAGAVVHVWDTEEQTCSLVRTWSKAAGREPMGAIAAWLDAECQMLGVELHLGQAVSSDQVDAWRRLGHQVLLCTGGRRRSAEYDVADGVRVFDAVEALDGTLSFESLPAGPIRIWDPIGGPIGVSIAESLAHVAGESNPVSLITQDQIAGTLLSLTGDLASASTRLMQSGVEIIKHREVRVVTDTTITVEESLTGTTEELPAAVVIDCGHRIPDHQLGTGDAGDAVAPRTIYEAMLEGRRMAIAAITTTTGVRS